MNYSIKYDAIFSRKNGDLTEYYSEVDLLLLIIR